jgi:hypothetical protein
LESFNDVVLPSGKASFELSQNFSDFFINTIECTKDNITPNTDFEICTVNLEADVDTTMVLLLEEFTSVTEEEVERIIEHSANKSCELDPIPTWLLKLCLQERLPIIPSIINLSVKTASVPPAFKSAHIRPVLKKANLELNTLKNYRPGSNLPFISKVLEKVVNSHIEGHLILNNLH